MELETVNSSLIWYLLCPHATICSQKGLPVVHFSIGKLYDYAVDCVLPPTFWARLNVCSSAAQAGLATLRHHHPKHAGKIWLGQAICGIVDLGLLVHGWLWFCTALHKWYMDRGVSERRELEQAQARWEPIMFLANEGAGVGTEAVRQTWLAGLENFRAAQGRVEAREMYFFGRIQYLVNFATVAVAVTSLAVPSMLNERQRPAVDLQAILHKVCTPLDAGKTKVKWGLLPELQHFTCSLMVCKVVMHLALALISSNQPSFALSALLQGLALWQSSRQWWIHLKGTIPGAGIATMRKFSCYVQIPRCFASGSSCASLTDHFAEHLMQACSFIAQVSQSLQSRRKITLQPSALIGCGCGMAATLEGVIKRRT